MNLGWYWHRLRSMSVPEVAHRFVEQAKKSRARNMVQGWARFASSEAGPIPTLPGFAEAIDGAPDALRHDAAAAAARFMAGEFSALGATWPKFTLVDGQSDIWHLDPITLLHWPSDRYCFDVGYRGSTEMGDVKYAWEFSRLQFLQPVALHARYSGASDAVAFVERAISSWHASNPPFKGVAWSSGIELALRAISLLVVTSLIGDRLSADSLRRIEEILRAHAFWLDRYPSRFSSANNHLVSEDAALYLIGVTCSFMEGAEALASHAAKGLVREAQLQILQDGVAAEQSPTYGALTSELLLLCAFVAQQSDTPLAPALSERLGAFAQWIFWLAEPDGTVPAIGDDDEGRVLTLGQREPGYATSVAAAIAAFTGDCAHTPPHCPTFRNALVDSVEGASPPHGKRTFADGGYTVVRTNLNGDAVSLVIDHAPLGYLAIAAHGHADALAFTLSVNGAPLFVDPGTYLYHSGHRWRDWFRNTRAHNTVSVENAEQSVISGAFNWAHKAHARLDSPLDGADYTVQTSHDGYLKRFGVRHARRFALTNDGLELHDALLGGQARQAEIVLQLAPEYDASTEIEGVVISRDGTAVARVLFPQNGTVSQSRGEDCPDGGWVSPCFGKKVPATRLAWRGLIDSEGVKTNIRLVR